MKKAALIVSIIIAAWLVASTVVHCRNIGDNVRKAQDRHLSSF